MCWVLPTLPSYIIIRLQTMGFFCYKARIKEPKISTQLCDHWLALYPKVVKEKEIRPLFTKPIIQLTTKDKGRPGNL